MFGVGGQAFTIKLRKTAERSPTAMLLEPPHDINGTRNAAGPLRWRQMKSVDPFLTVAWTDLVDAIVSFSKTCLR